MIPYYVFVILLVLSVGMFALGALAYHGIRMLAVRPIYAQPQQRQQMSEAKMRQLATQMAQQQAMGSMFGHLAPMADVPLPPREQIIPDGDGRPSKEEAFAPMVAGKK